MTHKQRSEQHPSLREAPHTKKSYNGFWFFTKNMLSWNTNFYSVWMCITLLYSSVSARGKSVTQSTFSHSPRVRPNRKAWGAVHHPVRSHSGIDTFSLPWRRRAKDTAAAVSSSETFFLVNSAKTNNVLNALVILRAKFHVVSSLLSVLKIAILMLAYECPSTPLKIGLKTKLQSILKVPLSS